MHFSPKPRCFSVLEYRTLILNIDEILLSGLAMKNYICGDFNHN